MDLRHLTGVLLMLPLAACSSGTAPSTSAPSSTPTDTVTSTPPTGAAPSSGLTIAMSAGNVFTPSVLSVKVGETVTVTNTDSTHHTFTDSGVFNSDDLALGATFSYRFTKAGTFDFVCVYHERLGMKGTITVG